MKFASVQSSAHSASIVCKLLSSNALQIWQWYGTQLHKMHDILKQAELAKLHLLCRCRIGGVPVILVGQGMSGSTELLLSSWLHTGEMLPQNYSFPLYEIKVLDRSIQENGYFNLTGFNLEIEERIIQLEQPTQCNTNSRKLHTGYREKYK